MKVFCLANFLNDKNIDEDTKSRALLVGWPQNFDGKSKKEIGSIGVNLFLHTEWLKDIEDENKEKSEV